MSSNVNNIHNGISSTQDNNIQILNDIQSLQDIEQQLFNSLEENQNLTPNQQKQIIQKINDISNMRINLYHTLDTMNNYFATSLSSSRSTLAEQTTAIGIVENELNKSKIKLRDLEEDKNNKIRLIEINNYFGEKYAEHSNLMKIIVWVLLPILVLAILNRKGFLPTRIYYILVIIITIIGAIYFWSRLYSIFYRDPMNYQEYDWSFNPKAAPQGNNANTSNPWSIPGGLGTCIGDACCTTGMSWDSTLNKCKITNSPSTSNIATSASPIVSQPSNNIPVTKESFINDVLTKHAYSYKKPDIMLGSYNINPSNSNSFIQYGNY
jgi:hypothetical protein